MEIQELENKIKYYSELYYKGTPVISDEQFDALVDRLRKLKADSSVLTTGWGFEVDKDKVKHKYSHIGSLDKAKTFKDIPDKFKNKKIYISPKLDGLSAVVYYENGNLVKAVTRGNGVYGKDITDKLSIILGKTISDRTFTGAVRGELIINDTNWKMLLGKYDNLYAPRNFAAGIINRKELDEDIKYIDLVVYKVVGQENSTIFNTRDGVLNWLHNNFKQVIPIYYYPYLNEDAWNMYHEQTYKSFQQLGYGLDGLVLTEENVLYNSQTKGYVYSEVAFKFGSDTAETTVLDIEWTLSRTQRYVPVAILEPVELSGAIIQRATCNNAQMVRDWKLGKNAKVVITRSNEVIPCILEVLEESTQELPTHCPVCGQLLVWEGVDLKCNNKDCNNVKMSDLQQWCETIGETDGLQWTLMKQYLNSYGISSIYKLYDSRDNIMNDLLHRQLSITEQKVLLFFNKLFYDNVSFETALSALNIPRLGDKTAKLLSREYDLVYKLLTEGYTDTYKYKLFEIVKEATTMAILNNLDKLNNLRYLYHDVANNKHRITLNQSFNTNIQYVAVTGSLNSMKRDAFEKYINEFGYELSSNLKKCRYLITNNPDSGSSKNKQAKEYGVEIITEQSFLDILK